MSLRKPSAVWCTIDAALCRIAKSSGDFFVVCHRPCVLFIGVARLHNCHFRCLSHRSSHKCVGTQVANSSKLPAMHAGPVAVIGMPTHTMQGPIRVVWFVEAQCFSQNHMFVLLLISVRLGIAPQVTQRLPSPPAYRSSTACTQAECWEALDGLHDARGCGTFVDYTMSYVRARQPLIFILENVSFFCTVHNVGALAWLPHKQEVVNAYWVTRRVVCISRCGLSQTRRRWYLVAINPKLQTVDFTWPSKVEPIPLSSLLGPRPRDASSARRPSPDVGLAARNVLHEVALLMELGADASFLHRMLDCDALRS